MLIDDARLFNGTGDYPTIDELRSYVHRSQSAVSMNIQDDIIRLAIS